jgi:opacity protein-like surface antigen
MIFSGGRSLAADQAREKNIGASLYLGAYPGGGDIYHTYGYPSGKYNTTFSYGGGLHYRSIDFIYSTRLNLSIETQSIDLASDPVSDLWGDCSAEYDGYALPVIFWCELVPESRFGPFVRIGIGAMLLDLSDQYNDPDLADRSGRYWSVAFGLGGGIFYCVSEHIDIQVIVQGMIGPQESSFINEDDVEYKLEAYAVYFYGINLRYWF